MCSVLGNSRLPDIYFRSDGRIDITADVVAELGIHDGDVIDIWQEDKEQLLYILHRSENIFGRHIAVCHGTRKHHKYMRAWCVKLCRHILSVCGGDVREAHLFVGLPIEHPRIGKAIPIITKNNLFKKAIKDGR